MHELSHTTATVTPKASSITTWALCGNTVYPHTWCHNSSLGHGLQLDGMSEGRRDKVSHHLHYKRQKRIDTQK